MATYLDLKQRIIAELCKDDIDSGGDLEATLETHIARACEYYADTKFWFNSLITTAVTVGGTATIDVPATIRIVQRVTIPAYYRELREVTLDGLSDETVRSVPDWYAYYNDKLKLYPIPDAVYTLNIYGISQVAAPSLDADTSIWTNQAQDVIVAHVKMSLCRGVYRDPEGVQLAIAELQDALARLKRETARRLETPLRPLRVGRRYNIYTD